MLHHTDFRVHQNIEKGGPECELTQDIKRHSISWRTGKLDWKQKPIWLLQTLFILKIEIEQWIWPDVLKWYNWTESLPMHSSVFLKQTKKRIFHRLNCNMYLEAIFRSFRYFFFNANIWITSYSENNCILLMLKKANREHMFISCPAPSCLLFCLWPKQVFSNME